MILSNKLKSIIAKSGVNGQWLPLCIHAEDTAGIISYLVRNRYNSLCDICDIEYNTFKKTAVLLAYVHDIGKITPIFQSNILKSLPERRSVFEHLGINNIPDSFHDKSKYHHTKCGEDILLKFGFSKDFSSIVGAHHGMPVEKSDNLIEIKPKCFFGNPQNKEFWNGLYNEWIDFSLEKAGFTDINEIPILNKRAMVLLSGLLIMSDWMSSNQTKFNLLSEEQFLPEDTYPKDRLKNALDLFDLPDIWKSGSEKITDSDFRKYFSFSMNKMQKSVIQSVENCIEPGLFILEAQMGTGKTEAALAVAEILACKCEKNGIFFGLPTQVTANGIFERIVPWASVQSSEQFHKISVNLAHGNADFQPVFESIKNMSKVDEDGDKYGYVTVNSFFMGSKQSLLADFVVGTVDRLLMSALKRKHVMLLHLGFSQKVVIIDECHAYDAYMNQYLNMALTWLHEYHVPVILLSATLPPDRRKSLIEAYINCDGTENLNFLDVPYPRLTYTDGKNIKALSLPTENISKEITIIRTSDDCIPDEIVRAAEAGACVGIICNTVSRAQHFAQMAREIKNTNVILYHAQFIIPDRIEKEKLLKKAVGKYSSTERKGTIVVGTQVLEQSLDIDFDILITDLCPMDFLLQRIGRLQRHLRPDRPHGYEHAKCIVLYTDEIDKSSENIYTRWLLLRTNKLLPEKINLPEDIDSLVCKTYMETTPEGKDEQTAYKEYNKQIETKKSKANGYLMAKPEDSRRDNTLHGWLINSTTDNDNNAQATVRDGTFSVEVIVLINHPDNSLSFLPWEENREKFFKNICPDNEQCKLIAQQKLKLPQVFCQNWNIDKTIKELEKSSSGLVKFQQSHWLRGELFLLLDENLCTHLNGYKVTYSQNEGLAYKKEDKN